MVTEVFSLETELTLLPCMRTKEIAKNVAKMYSDSRVIVP